TAAARKRGALRQIDCAKLIERGRTYVHRPRGDAQGTVVGEGGRADGDGLARGVADDAAVVDDRSDLALRQLAVTLQRHPAVDLQGLARDIGACEDGAPRVVDGGAARAALDGDVLQARGDEVPLAIALVHRHARGQGEVVGDLNKAALGQVAAD